MTSRGNVRRKTKAQRLRGASSVSNQTMTLAVVPPDNHPMNNLVTPSPTMEEVSHGPDSQSRGSSSKRQLFTANKTGGIDLSSNVAAETCQQAPRNLFRRNQSTSGTADDVSCTSSFSHRDRRKRRNMHSLDSLASIGSPTSSPRRKRAMMGETDAWSKKALPREKTIGRALQKEANKNRNMLVPVSIPPGLLSLFSPVGIKGVKKLPRSHEEVLKKFEGRSKKQTPPRTRLSRQCKSNNSAVSYAEESDDDLYLDNMIMGEEDAEETLVPAKRARTDVGTGNIGFKSPGKDDALSETTEQKQSSPSGRGSGRARGAMRASDGVSAKNASTSIHKQGPTKQLESKTEKNRSGSGRRKTHLLQEHDAAVDLGETSKPTVKNSVAGSLVYSIKAKEQKQSHDVGLETNTKRREHDRSRKPMPKEAASNKGHPQTATTLCETSRVVTASQSMASANRDKTSRARSTEKKGASTVLESSVGVPDKRGRLREHGVFSAAALSPLMTLGNYSETETSESRKSGDSRQNVAPNVTNLPPSGAGHLHNVESEPYVASAPTKRGHPRKSEASGVATLPTAVVGNHHSDEHETTLGSASWKLGRSHKPVGLGAAKTRPHAIEDHHKEKEISKMLKNDPVRGLAARIPPSPIQLRACAPSLIEIPSPSRRGESNRLEGNGYVPGDGEVCDRNAREVGIHSKTKGNEAGEQTSKQPVRPIVKSKSSTRSQSKSKGKAHKVRFAPTTTTFSLKIRVKTSASTSKNGKKSKRSTTTLSESAVQSIANQITQAYFTQGAGAHTNANDEHEESEKDTEEESDVESTSSSESDSSNAEEDDGGVEKFETREGDLKRSQTQQIIEEVVEENNDLPETEILVEESRDARSVASEITMDVDLLRGEPSRICRDGGDDEEEGEQSSVFPSGNLDDDSSLENQDALDEKQNTNENLAANSRHPMEHNLQNDKAPKQGHSKEEQRSPEHGNGDECCQQRSSEVPFSPPKKRRRLTGMDSLAGCSIASAGFTVNKTHRVESRVDSHGVDKILPSINAAPLRSLRPHGDASIANSILPANLRNQKRCGKCTACQLEFDCLTCSRCISNMQHGLRRGEGAPCRKRVCRAFSHGPMGSLALCSSTSRINTGTTPQLRAEAAEKPSISYREADDVSTSLQSSIGSVYSRASMRQRSRAARMWTHEMSKERQRRLQASGGLGAGTQDGSSKPAPKKRRGKKAKSPMHDLELPIPTDDSIASFNERRRAVQALMEYDEADQDWY